VELLKDGEWLSSQVQVKHSIHMILGKKYSLLVFFLLLDIYMFWYIVLEFAYVIGSHGTLESENIDEQWSWHLES
jgi:hypothetical protein